MLNPLSAYHDGDISQNKDYIRFLNGALGALLDELRIGLFAFHQKGKPPRGQHGKNNQQEEDVYFQVMYDILGGSTLILNTNGCQGIKHGISAHCMNEWLHNLPVWWMALVVFAGTYLATGGIFAIPIRLA